MTTKIPGAEKVDAVTVILNVADLLTEASDLSFGSTLNEQVDFTSKLEAWINQMFSSELPDTNNELRNAPWDNIFRLVSVIVSWLPKLCMALEIHTKCMIILLIFLYINN